VESLDIRHNFLYEGYSENELALRNATNVENGGEDED